MIYKKIIGFAFCLSLVLISQSLCGQVRLPKLVRDSMVVQRDIKLKIWGWAAPAEKVNITFNGKKYKATTGTDGKWVVELPPMKAGGPFTMNIKASNEITIKNILVGDVWICSGQSNMVHYLDLHKERYADEIAQANYPEIRHFLISTRTNLQGPVDDLPGGFWKSANPQDVKRFSVVAYFFARKIYEKYHVPIGLINASVGGTPIEAWTSEAGLKDFSSIINTVQKNKDTTYVNRANRMAAAANRANAQRKPEDKGLTEAKVWYDTTYAPKNWHDINIPGYWEDQGIKDLDGVVWYRREIDVPASMTNMPAKVSLGRIVDADFLYVNGVQAGNTGYQYPQRKYQLPAGLLKPGKNIFVIRVLNNSGKGGFVPDKPYSITAGGQTLDLKGTWQYKVGEAYVRNGSGGGGIAAQNQPTALFNAMIAPITNYGIKGILWYQGESNTSRAEEYAKLLPAFIADWRNQWKQGDIPFLYVQLPNFMDANYLPSESEWAILRNSQLKALSIPNTAMAVAIDLGEWNDIHPGNKKPIGERLALAAQRLAYNDKDVVYSGPAFSASSIAGNKVTMSFNHTGSGLISCDGEELRLFAIAGEDKKFAWAQAIIKGDKIEVWNEGILNPVYVRYAWADNPDGANLCNKEGLPASPFEAQVADINKLWHGKRAAVVLTYDDALDVQLDNAIPALDSLGLKGSFYLSASFPGSKNRIQDWRKAARNGHELGNHTLYHPCDASKPGRSWVTPQNDLSKYTTDQIVREVEMTNVFLESLDGKKERTFAYTCGDMETGSGSFVEAIKNQFVSMRGVSSRVNKLETLDLTNIDCFVVDNNNANQLVQWAEKAKEENGLLVVLFHGVGGGHSINTDRKKHNDFLKYLKDHPDDFWVTTMLEASKHSIQMRKNKK